MSDATFTDHTGDDAEAVPLDPSTELLADLQRIAAEYANYRKRVERERVNSRELVIGEVLAAFLGVLDDIGRARSHAILDGALKAVADGLDSAASSFGLTAFGLPGDRFDPFVHEALAETGDPRPALTSDGQEIDAPVVVEVFQSGYKIHERVLRPALVSVTG